MLEGHGEQLTYNDGEKAAIQFEETDIQPAMNDEEPLSHSDEGEPA